MTTPPTPAGWYPDPDGSGGRRYWDGSLWTAHRSPAPAESAAPDNRKLITGYHGVLHRGAGGEGRGR